MWAYNGTIKEKGTYKTPMKDGVVFFQIMDKYSNPNQEDHAFAAKDEKAVVVVDDKDELDAKEGQAVLMQAEGWNTSTIIFETSSKYLKFAGRLVWTPIILLLLTLLQSFQGESLQ
ncbi:Multidrug resistance-associated ABC transporter [Mycena venus]|uniref:Multidrug resistance-associated ABC transporter n=1 Tax=Mycena venus TaxID=2733690 RepID=A0A8H7DBV2_9AGAR|nr:Multidrug resistance-associated ABC transporter [Mycena venus]